MLSRLLIPKFIVQAALLSGVAFAIVGTHRTASAAPTRNELKEARATFRTGLALETAGDYKGALGKFREVAAVIQTPEVTFHIGVCLENLGRWTEALGNYRIAIDRAGEDGKESVANSADAARKTLEGKMPRVIVVRGKGSAGAVVQLDGVRIGAASFGTEMPADPGGHRITATIDGEKKFDRTVDLKEGRTATISVELIEDPSPLPSSKPIATKQAGPSVRTGYIFLGAGITSIVVGGMFLKLRGDTIDQLESQCIRKQCSKALQGTSDRGKIYTMAANGFLGAGVISAGIGTVVLLQTKGPGDTPTPKQPGTRVSVSAVGPAGSSGATLWGSF